jgi:methylenetetrahydrofolate reductase (NADPH)
VRLPFSFGKSIYMVEKPSLTAVDARARFEVLPLGCSEEEAARLPEPVRLTVTCSPKHGPDRSVEVAGRLHALGHAVTVHLAARMVRDRAHLDALMAGMAAAGVDDVFVIGGDTDPPLGAFASAVELVPLIAAHPERPRTIGIAGYPEGHPLISPAELDEALREKSRFADYITTQMCFDPEALRAWITRQREQGMTLPVLIGMPGKVARRRLLEMSLRIGVGPSLAFLRKQRGLRSLLSRRSTADRLYRALAPSLEDQQLNVAGFHFFTFNQLIDTWEWQQRKQGAASDRGDWKNPAATRGYVHPEERTT